MRINWFLPVDHTDYNRMSASVWIRCLQLLPHLERLGVESAINRPERPADFAIFLRLQDRSILPTMAQQRKQGATVIFDMVVNYFEPSGPVAGLGEPVSAAQVATVGQLVQAADAVTCASRFIAERAGAVHDSVFVIPDSIDFDHFRHTISPAAFEQKRLTAVWSGVAKKSSELEELLPLLARHHIDLKMISDRRPTFARWGRQIRGRLRAEAPHIRFSRWRYNTFPQEIATAQIGLSPRALDSPYNRGHSSFKIAVLMAQGLPILASPVPSYLDLMGPKASPAGGRFCDSAAEWEQALADIAAKRERLYTWHQEAIAAAEQISTKAITARLHEILEAL